VEDDAGPASPSPPPTLAGRIERLFAVHRPPDDPERHWRNSEVIAATRAAGRDLSESHLSELRRGIKTNPTMKTLDAIATFFDVRVGYFVDDAVAIDVERELCSRQEQFEARALQRRVDLEAEQLAARELQRALRLSGVTKSAHRGGGGDPRQRAEMMRALARVLLEDDESAGDGDQGTDVLR
jgi:transcriptional regulator with XRE-family HTH domain